VSGGCQARMSGHACAHMEYSVVYSVVLAMCGWRAQVWRDALAEKAQSPYVRQTLSSSGLRGLRFCPYEARPLLELAGAQTCRVLPHIVCH
jgi:hypothetical protein